MFRQSSPLVQFYYGHAPDFRGRMIAEILAWDHEQLERTHDYIQWLFPLKERSGANPSAPTLDDSQIAEFRSSRMLTKRVRDALQIMLDFYGLRCEETKVGPRIVKSEMWNLRSKEWLTPENHNFLRVTRILISLRALGLEAYAQAFYAALVDIYRSERGNIGAHTFGFWQRTMQGLQ
jgi:opioid growth factor receptor-like protein